MFSKGLIIYTGVIGVGLYIFLLYYMCGLTSNNVASNEDLRLRWNGSRLNEHNVAIYRDKSSRCHKFRLFVNGELNHSSRLKAWCQLKKEEAKLKQLKFMEPNNPDIEE
jgi:hypothetical protein